MTKRMTYLEIPARDATRTADFYRAVCGWEVEERKPGDYRFSDDDVRLFGRFVTDRGAAAPEVGQRLYFYVPDVAEALTRAEALGGKVSSPRALEGDTYIARVQDPSGNLVGLWQFE